MLIHTSDVLFNQLHPLLCPAAAVEVAVADGFGEVFGLDVFAAI